VTPNWIGFAEATEHQAPLSSTDQPSLSLNSPGQNLPGSQDAAAEQKPPVTPVMAPTTQSQTPEKQSPAANSPAQPIQSDQAADRVDLATPEFAPPIPEPIEPDSRPDTLEKNTESSSDDAEDVNQTRPTDTENSSQSGPELDELWLIDALPVLARREPNQRDRDSRDEQKSDSDAEALQEAERDISEREVPSRNDVDKSLDEVEKRKATSNEDRPITPPTPPPPRVFPQSQLPEIEEAIPITSVPPPATQAAKSSDDSAGIKSDRESDASSTRRPIDVRPGQTVATAGLQIFTRRIQLARYVRISGMAGNPVAKIDFLRSGKVKNVTIVTSSGSDRVDEPVRNALHGWTARGEKLDALPASDPEATVSVTIRIVFPR
jgi:hypothetical protein